MNFAKELRKALASVTLGAMVFTIMPQVSFAGVEDFTDVAEIPAWADEAIEELMDMGVVSGNDDGSFAPNRQLNRAEVAKVIVLATGIDLDTTGGPHFPDVPENAWFYDYVETMYNYGWINGYPDGFFRPAVGINRAEIAKMVINAFEIDQDTSGAPHFDDASSSDWYYGYVETAYNYGLMRGYGDGTFGPANAVTRAETVKIVYDALLVVSEPVGPSEGTLEVSLSDYTPRGTNIPFNATSVPFTTVEMTASDDSDVEISALTFTRLGLGDNDDFDNVWLEVDGFKVGNDKSVNNDDLVELRFNPPLIVPAGQTIIADVVASMDAFSSTGRLNTGHHNRFAVISGEDLVSSAQNIVGDFPIEGEEMEIADYEVSQLDFVTLGTDSTVDVGDNFIETGKFRLVNDSNSNKDIELRAITFKNDGSAEIEDVLENVAMYVSGEQVSAETIIDGDYITFRLDNGVTGGYIIEDGDSRIFSMRADIVSAEKGDTINLKIDNFEDIIGVEIGTSFGVKTISSKGLALSTSSTGASTSSANVTCSGSPAEDDCARLAAYTVDSGDLNVSRDPASLGNQQYAPGSNDVTFMTSRVVVDQPVIIDGVTISVESGSTVADKSKDSNTTANNASDFNAAFDNFRLYLNDKLIDTTNTFMVKSGGVDGTATDLELVFNTTFEVAGTSILKLVGNVEDEAIDGDKVKVGLDADNFDAPEYISTGDQLTTDETVGSALASFVEIEASSITIARIDGLSDGDDIVAGVDDLSAMQFVLDNNDSGDVNTTSVNVSASIASTDSCSNYTLAIFVDGTQQGSAKNLEGNTTTCSADFNDISVVVPSSDQKEFTIVMDTIEASANADTANTTATTCSATAQSLGTETVLATAINAGTSAVNATSHGLVAGDTVAVGVGTVVLSAVDTEVKTVASVTDANNFVISGSFSQGHPITQVITKVTTECSAGATTVTLADVSDVVVNDVLSVGGQTCIVSSISGNVVTCSAGLGLAVPLPATVTETSSDNKVRLFVTGVEVDNVENGQSVAVVENSRALGSVSSYTEGATEDGDCDGVNAETLTQNYLCGAEFDLLASGRLSVSLETTVFSDIIVANSTDVEVLKVRFNASDDEIHVEDLYFVDDTATVNSTADAEDRLDFKLYNAAGQLVQEKQMIDGKLHFELANQDRIQVPKDDSTFVTVKVDARDLNDANQTGAHLELDIAQNAGTGNTGFEAVTAATGSDLTSSFISGGATVKGERFVVYRSELSIMHAATQPNFTDPATGAQEVYRFTVSADAERQVELGRVSFDVALQGMTSSNTAIVAADFAVYQVKTDGTVDTNSTVTSSIALDGDKDGTVNETADSSASTATVQINFSNQNLAAGESRTYAMYLANTTNTTGTNSQSDDDSVSVTIVRDSAYDAPATRTAQEAAGLANTIVWSDEAASNHSNSTSDWLNGYLVEIDTTAEIVEDGN